MNFKAICRGRATNIVEAGIARGQRAWARIKATAEEQRTLWLEVGVALMYGKQKGNRKVGQKFSVWVQEVFPGLNQDTAADAIWWASNSVMTTEIPAGLSHPKNIRQWFNETQAAAQVPADLAEEPAPAPSVVLEQRTAEKVSKLIHRSRSGDEGSAQAIRAVEAYAKQHGTTVEKLT